MEFAERLKALREKNELTQEELGKLINSTRQTISNYETGKREPDLKTLNDIADIFNIDIDYFFGRTNYGKDSSKSIVENYEFITKEEAVEYILKQKVISNDTGVDVTKYTDKEMENFTNRLLDYVKFLDIDKKR